MPNPQAVGPPFVGCLRLLFQYIWSYLTYMEAFSSIHNLRMCHAMVIRAPPNMVVRNFHFQICNFLKLWPPKLVFDVFQNTEIYYLCMLCTETNSSFCHNLSVSTASVFRRVEKKVDIIFTFRNFFTLQV
jgi:hypothetical protein